MTASTFDEQARAAVVAAAGNFVVPLDGFPFRSILSRCWPPDVILMVVADPGAALNPAAIATVVEVVTGGKAAVLCSTCAVTRNRVREAILFAADTRCSPGTSQ